MAEQSGLWAITADYTPHPLVKAAVEGLAQALSVAMEQCPPDVLVESLVVMIHQTEAAYRLSSEAMDDDVLETHVDAMTDKQRERLREQGAAPVALMLTNIAISAIIEDLSEGIGITVEHLSD